MIAGIRTAGSSICRSMSSASKIVTVSSSLMISRIGTPPTLMVLISLVISMNRLCRNGVAIYYGRSTHDLRFLPMRRETRRCEDLGAAAGAKVEMADRCAGPNAVLCVGRSGFENARPTQRASLRWVANALSQTARQSLPHRPWHLNSFDRPPIRPPHSGQTQFRIADT